MKLSDAYFFKDLLADLNKRKIQSIIVEGGAKTIQSFIDVGLWDEARVFQSSNCFGSGIQSPQLKNAEFDGKEGIMGDILTYFKRK